MTRTAAPLNANPAFHSALSRHIVVPLLVSVGLCTCFLALMFYLLSVNRWIDRADQTTSQTHHALKELVDAETGLRGYLGTGRTLFLEPYNTSNEQLPATFAALKDQVAADPLQAALLGQIQSGYQSWRQYAQRMLALRQSTDPHAQALVQGALAEEGKQRMDAMRGAFDQLMAAQEALRATRSHDVSTAISVIVVLTILAAVGIGVLLGSIGRRRMAVLAATYDSALARHETNTERLEAQAALASGLAALGHEVLGEQSVAALSHSILNQLVKFFGAATGAMYVSSDNASYVRRAQYGWRDAALALRPAFNRGDSLAGEVVASNEVKLLPGLAAGHVQVSTLLGDSAPEQVLLMPARGAREVNAVIELGFTGPAPAAAVEFAQLASFNIGMAIESAQYRERLQSVLHETQQLNEELQTQQEELRVANEELTEQSRLLAESQLKLENQQAELEQNNEQLGVHSAALQVQKDLADKRNDALELAQQQLEQRARELAQASQYKSEFLANMSHELRTPLNSSLILASLLGANAKGNLDEEQVRFANTIHTAGLDLLALINDVLDLSKVEAGKLEVWPQSLAIDPMLDNLEQLFRPLAESRQLGFGIKKAPGVPVWMHTDAARLQQILKNLLSNAIKFTEQGSVVLTVAPGADNHLTFAVQDSGIGIAPAYLPNVFEAFSQADGATNRQYGGTGLGLSISRDLARLLGGDIAVESKQGEGSVFTLSVLRELRVGVEPTASTALDASTPPASEIAQPVTAPAIAVFPTRRDGARTVLIIEDDAVFAETLTLLGTDQGFDCLVAQTAESGLALALAHRPDAILLDVKLPDQSGLALLEQLKQTPALRHVPVHMMSGEDRTEAALQLGAIGYALKPVNHAQLLAVFARLEEQLTRTVREVLLVEDDAGQRESIRALIGATDVHIVAVPSAAEALKQLEHTVFDCMIVDLGLPDMQGSQLLEQMAASQTYAFPPVIVYTGRELSRQEEHELRRYSHSIIIKGAHSPERLLDEVTLFLHQVESQLPADRQQMLKAVRNRENIFEGRKVLVVDDDVRNIFALTSVLEQKGIEVEIGRNGQEALDRMAQAPGIDLVLMDIMMPLMDGFEAIRRLREQPAFKRLPIIAITARATRDDQERCMTAGASDYLAKPIELDKLLGLLRVWMPRH
ncbi:response regulator [Amantichitinum ursilacus]|uniref:Virulence sensor protein BvgS n=1 Tax=Amantichitinum ursilacus TaxID=857265 RepID=A0A0N0GL18_9NEIS|nr:response regulator [Amantichitinum ursilacus]KPC49634.1 Sensory/regulatory protein RpfC [Amantichitinum ursilacus]